MEFLKSFRTQSINDLLKFVNCAWFMKIFLSHISEYFLIKLLSICRTLWWRRSARRWWIGWWSRSRQRQILRIRINRRHDLSRHNRRCSRGDWGCGRCQSWCRYGADVGQAHFSIEVHVMVLQLIVQLIVELVHLVVLSQVLSDLGMAVLVVGHDDIARISRRHARFAVVLSRQITLPVLFILANVLNAERVSVVNQQRLALKTNKTSRKILLLIAWESSVVSSPRWLNINCSLPWIQRSPGRTVGND